MTAASYPMNRPRRLRAQPWIRRMVRECALSPADFIWPIFLLEGSNRIEPVASMPGVTRMTLDRALPAVERAARLGISMVALFPSLPPERKSLDCAEAWREDTLVCQAARAIKTAIPEIGVMQDVALDPYNALGHDGVVIDGRIDNDASIEALIRQALAQAAAGSDVLGPSDMMDGRIGAIRSALEEAGYQDTLLLAYAAKYASAFYGPFRDAVGANAALGGSDAAPGDKCTYQMDPGNSDEALREVALDLAEGADMVMVKPGLPYLDVCRRVKDAFNVPVFAYQVSGEYAMIEAAAAAGWLNRDEVIEESLIAFKRAGCSGILTYYAVEMAERIAKRAG